MDVTLAPPGAVFRRDFRNPESQRGKGGSEPIKLLQVMNDRPIETGRHSASKVPLPLPLPLAASRRTLSPRPTAPALLRLCIPFPLVYNFKHVVHP